MKRYTKVKSKNILKYICSLLANIDEDRSIENNTRDSITSHVIYFKNKIKVEIRKETVAHNKPHMHITHTDKMDVSICLNTLTKITGEIDSKMYKEVMKILSPFKETLLNIWNNLNEYDNEVFAEKIINNLPWKKSNIPIVKRKLFMHKRPSSY